MSTNGTAGTYDDWGPGDLTGAQREAAYIEVVGIIGRHVAVDGPVPAAELPALTRDLADLIEQISLKAWDNGHREGFNEGALGEDL